MRPCANAACFTGSVDIARKWPECVKNVTGKRTTELQNEGKAPDFTRDTATGYCEYIDCDMLRRNLQPSAASAHASMKGWIVLAFCFVNIYISII